MIQKVKVTRAYLEKQLKFTTLVKDIQRSLNSKEYKKQGYSFNEYIKLKWNISQAQAYRFLTCAKVIDQLQEFEIQPCYERLCKSLSTVAKTPTQMKYLWAAILEKTGGRPDYINSTHITQIWNDLCKNEKYSKICNFEEDIMSKVEKSINKFENEKKHKQFKQKPNSTTSSTNISYIPSPASTDSLSMTQSESNESLSTFNIQINNNLVSPDINSNSLINPQSFSFTESPPSEPVINNSSINSSNYINNNQITINSYNPVINNSSVAIPNSINNNGNTNNNQSLSISNSMHNNTINNVSYHQMINNSSIAISNAINNNSNINNINNNSNINYNLSYSISNSLNNASKPVTNNASVALSNSFIESPVKSKINNSICNLPSDINATHDSKTKNTFYTSSSFQVANTNKPRINDSIYIPSTSLVTSKSVYNSQIQKSLSNSYDSKINNPLNNSSSNINSINKSLVQPLVNKNSTNLLDKPLINNNSSKPIGKTLTNDSIYIPSSSTENVKTNYNSQIENSLKSSNKSISTNNDYKSSSSLKSKSKPQIKDSIYIPSISAHSINIPNVSQGNYNVYKSSKADKLQDPIYIPSTSTETVCFTQQNVSQYPNQLPQQKSLNYYQNSSQLKQPQHYINYST